MPTTCQKPTNADTEIVAAAARGRRSSTVGAARTAGSRPIRVAREP